MKVTTDACLFGAWIPLDGRPKTILDIGSGTGLLSLMLAQRTTESIITGVELDAAAAQQAKENVGSSPFSNRINIAHQSIQEFAASSHQKFDLIVSNPPFFKNHLTSPEDKVNAARHQETLTFEELSSCISALRSPNGRVAILLPENESHFFTEKMRCFDLWPSEEVQVLNKPNDAVFRKMVVYQQGESCRPTQLHIRDHSGQYSAAFQALLSSFYLKL